MVGAAWTPDGQHVAFSEIREDLCYLGLVDIATEEVTRILEHPECEHEDLFPRFAPEGRRVVFQREGEGGTAIYSATIDGLDVQQLSGYGLGARPDWSPDGEWIVFQGRENEPPDIEVGVAIHRIRPDGSDRERLTTPGGSNRDYYPRWLPDGSHSVADRTCGRPSPWPPRCR